MNWDLNHLSKAAGIVVAMVAVLTLILKLMKNKTIISRGNEGVEATNTNTNTNTNTIIINKPEDAQLENKHDGVGDQSLADENADFKRTKRILFIDDDKDFKIVNILKRMGWLRVNIVTDLHSLEQAELVDGDVIIVDIQGVGILMGEPTEGLGLALSIKRRYPEKKVIIYSANESGSRFDEALHECDYALPKTSEPIRFEDTILKVLRR